MQKQKGNAAVIALLAVALFATVCSALYFATHRSLAGTPGPDHYNQENFLAGSIDGGGANATSTSGTVVPLLARDFDIENMIDVMLNVQSATLSFPASSTLSNWLIHAGDRRVLFVRNATTTAATTLTISGGTGVIVKFASTTPATNGVMTGDTDGANYARIELIRKTNRDFEALVSFFKD